MSNRTAFSLVLCLLIGSGLALSFSAATPRYLMYGPSLPAVCDPSRGDIFFQTAGTVGPYFCSAANTWTALNPTLALATWPGSTAITTLGTIATGTWHGTPIAAAYVGAHAANHAGSGSDPITSLGAVGFTGGITVAQPGGNMIVARYNSGDARGGIYTTGSAGVTFVGGNLVYSGSGNVFNYDTSGPMWYLGNPSGTASVVALGAGTAFAGTSAGTDNLSTARIAIAVSTGNVLINSLTDDGTNKLQINGTARAAGFNVSGTPGASGTITIPHLTTTGANGSITVSGGIITAFTNPT